MFAAVMGAACAADVDFPEECDKAAVADEACVTECLSWTLITKTREECEALCLPPGTPGSTNNIYCLGDDPTACLPEPTDPCEDFEEEYGDEYAHEHCHAGGGE